MTFEKEIRELFELSMQVLEETDHHVKFDVDEHMCNVYIMHNGFRAGGKYDGIYSLFNDAMLRVESKTNYANAKVHLLRLLEKETEDEKDGD